MPGDLREDLPGRGRLRQAERLARADGAATGRDVTGRLQRPVRHRARRRSVGTRDGVHGPGPGRRPCSGEAQKRKSA